MSAKKVKLSENSLILPEIQIVWNNRGQKRSLSLDVRCPVSGQILACVMKGEGEGRGEKETLTRKHHDFEKLRSSTNAGSNWGGACSID